MTIDQWLAGVLRGDSAAVTTRPDNDVDAVIAAAEHHSVVPLVADALGARASNNDQIVPLVDRIRTLAVQHAAVDLAREGELRSAIRALDAAGTTPIIFKGAHLAYACYARPDLRPRIDSDVLIDPAPASRDAAHEALLALGYTTTPHVGGELVMAQRSYVKRRDTRLIHAVDVHWRLSNPLAFAGVLSHEELLRDAQPIPALGPAARGPSMLHALVIACVHRVAHHADADCLIWLYDIDRIARRLDAHEWREFADLIADRQIAAVCHASLQRTVDTFATPIPDLRSPGSPDPGASQSPERTARFLDGRRPSMAGALDDLRATPSWRAKLRLAREHLLPPATYMRGVYTPESRAPIAWLYAKRVLAGARTWLISRR